MMRVFAGRLFEIRAKTSPFRDAIIFQMYIFRMYFENDTQVGFSVTVSSFHEMTDRKLFPTSYLVRTVSVKRPNKKKI